MKFLVVFTLCMAAVSAALPPIPTAGPTLLKSDFTKDDNTYSFGYEQSDRQVRQETGIVKDAGLDTKHVTVTGSFSFVAPDDGITYTVTYVADENGFQPTGAHLPSV